MNDLKINAQHIADLKNAMQQAIDDGEIAKVDAPLEHYFAAGLYGRRIFVPAGTTVVTKVHKVQHIAIALKGTCTVIDQDGKKSIVSAPSVFITEPGTQRAIFCHDDVEYINAYLEALCKAVYDTFETIEDSYIQNLLDGITELIKSTIYKLQNLH